MKSRPGRGRNKEGTLRRGVWLGVALIVLVCGSYPHCRAPTVEERLRSQASTALKVSGLDDSILRIDGCAVTLSGSVETEEQLERAEVSVAAISGICTLANRLVVEGSDSRLDLATIRLSTVGDVVTISGAVPSRRFQAVLVAAARERWGADSVVDQISIEPDVDTGGWPVSFVGVLNALHGLGQDLDVVIGGGRIQVTGSVLSPLQRARVVGAVTSALPGIELIDRIIIREPKGPADELQVAIDLYLDGKVIDFVENSVQLTPIGREVLDGMVEILRDTDESIEISGHTDSINSTMYNLDLSQRRAESVRGYLAWKRINRKRFRAVGYGESRPIAPNNTETGRLANRRIEFRVLWDSLRESQ